MPVTVNPREVPAEQILEVRSQLLTDAERIVSDAAGAELRGEAATEFRAIEAAVNVLDQRAQAAGIEALNGRYAPMIDTLPGAGAFGAGGPPVPGYAETRQYGLPIVRFRDIDIRSAHEALMNGQAAQIGADLETRTVTGFAQAPMATIPVFNRNPIPFRREPTRISDLLPSQPVVARSVTYYTQPTAASAAAPTGEAQAKPASDPAWTAVTTKVSKIAHLVEVTKEALDDIANFAQIVSDEMVRGLILQENFQLVSGDGTGENLTGFLNGVGILTYAPGSAEDRAKSIRHAITLLRNGSSFAEADLIIMNPADAEIFDLTNYASAGLHAVMDNDSPGGSAAVAGSPSRQAWGARIVETSQITSGTALVMNAADAAVTFLREPPTVFVDPYSKSAFNEVRFICEERIGLGLLRPSAILKVTFNGTA